MGPEEGIDVSDPLQLVVITYVVMAVVMGFLWVVQRKTKNAAIVDVAWCAGLIAAVLSYMTQAPAGVERILLTAIQMKSSIKYRQQFPRLQTQAGLFPGLPECRALRRLPRFTAATRQTDLAIDPLYHQ